MQNHVSSGNPSFLAYFQSKLKLNFKWHYKLRMVVWTGQEKLLLWSVSEIMLLWSVSYLSFIK